MADIYEFVGKSNNSRPKYTSYELAKQVREKRRENALPIPEFAAKYGVDEKILREIEEGKCSFSPRHYRACGNILQMTDEELLAEDIDDEKAVSYRVSDMEKGIKETVDMANMLFNEIIMQEKIGAN